MRRVWQHKTEEMKGFTSKYKVNQLVYYEIHGDIMEAIKREKNIQSWKRDWKLQLIEKNNSKRDDLYPQSRRVMSPLINLTLYYAAFLHFSSINLYS